MNTTDRSIESVTLNYSKSLLERGFSKGHLRTFKPFHSTGLCFTNRIILGLVISGNLEVLIISSQTKSFCFLPICMFRYLQEYWERLCLLLVRNSQRHFFDFDLPS